MSTFVGLAVATMVAAPVSAAEKIPAKGTAVASRAVEPGPRFTPTVKPSAAHGEKVFVEYCAVCHGLHGKGDGPRSAFFAESQYIPDLTTEGFLAGRDEELKENIRSGLARFDEPALVMPQFKYILGATDIESVVAYVKTFAPPEPKTKPKKK
ncbi:MAG: cytochrome c [Siculibacillus sp.]